MILDKLFQRLTTIFFILLALSCGPVSSSENRDKNRQAIEALEKKDYALALKIIRPLAEAGDPFAQWLLGDMYADGEGLPKDAKAAIKWWQEAAAKGMGEAAARLGDAYAAGDGAPKDWGQATTWWRKAADSNVPRAQTAIGLSLYFGRGVQENKVESSQWFQKAADANQTQAQAMLSRLYFFGEGGLPQSYLQAYKWVLIAGEEGKELTEKTRIMLESILRGTERQEAMRQAEQWKFERGKVKAPPPPPLRDEDLPVSYFVKSSSLSAKCNSSDPKDLTWCDAYIAGVVDTIGGRRNLDTDGREARFCFREKRLSAGQARENVKKALALGQEDKSGPAMDLPASGSVIAGVLVYFCK